MRGILYYMSGWDKVYKTGQFSIDTTLPSTLVAEYVEEIPEGSRVLDLGCGEGRNAVFLADRDHTVDAIDVADMSWPQSLRSSLASNINFEQVDINTIKHLEKSYGAFLMMRLLQYLKPKTVAHLFAMASNSLIPGGLVFVSYTTNGHTAKTRYGIDTYTHAPEIIQKLCAKYDLTVLDSKLFATETQHVPYDSDIEVCEMVVQKLASSSDKQIRY